VIAQGTIYPSGIYAGGAGVGAGGRSSGRWQVVGPSLIDRWSPIKGRVKKKNTSP
jgi:hypothetical protein